MSTNTMMGKNVTATKDASGNVVGLSAGGKSVSRPQTLVSAMRRIEQSMPVPLHIVAMGDSTGDATDEWCYNLATALATQYPAYTVDYRLFNDTTQQYDNATRLSTGTAGTGGISTGLAAATTKFQIADSAQIAITGDMDIRVKVNLGGQLPSAVMYFAGQFAAGNMAWYLDISTSGIFRIHTSVNGSTIVSHAATAALAGTDLSGDIWLRATIDADNGAAGHTTAFYKSTDNATWTQIGSNVVVAGTLTLHDSTAAFTFVGRGTTLPQQTAAIKFYACQLYGSLDGTVRKIDIDLGDQPRYTTNGTRTFVDGAGNTVTMTGDAGSTAIGAPRILIDNGSVGGTSIDYHYDATRYTKLVTVTPHIMLLNHGHNLQATLDYRAELKTLLDKVLASNPDAAIVLMTQNKRHTTATNFYDHLLRHQIVSDYAASQGFGLLDVMAALGDGYTTLGDTVHPDATGKALWSAAVQQYMGLA